MAMVDTADSALMASLYTSKVFARDPIAILYYSIVLTAITVVVSAFVAIVQVFSLVMRVQEPEGKFWDGVKQLTDNFDIVGGSICTLFVVVGVGSIIVYRPWRKRIERNERMLQWDSEAGGAGICREET
jgi:high-affinity nickel-transport protein